MRQFRIAIIGTRGIPANYGGFETFAEECAVGLVERGHDVTVYGRTHYVQRNLEKYRRVRIVVLPTLKWKYTDTVVHTFLCILHAIWTRFDAVLICNAANSIFCPLPRLFRMPVVVNVDGIERLRSKWSWPGRAYYRASEYLSTRLPNVMVTDARVMHQYYQETYGADSVCIPYGASTAITTSQQMLEELGLQPGGYYLYVGRLEPENNAHLVVEAFEQVRTSHRLVVVGDAPYSGGYIRKLKRTKDSRVLFPGAIYGMGYRELQAHALCYVHATEVGGTHPALLEAMGAGNVIVANETPENVEVVENAAILYRKNDVADLARHLQEVSDAPDRFSPLKSAARQRVAENYSWASVVERYERLFLELVHPELVESELIRPDTSRSGGASPASSNKKGYES